MTGILLSKEPLEATLYLSKHCPHCQEVLGAYDQVEENFRKMGFHLKRIFWEDEPDLFLIRGIEAVPTLMMPFQRPWMGIAPIWLIELDRLSRIVGGELSLDKIQHETQQNREKAGIAHNEKWDIARQHP